eukprot:CAMPEP_0197295506 /NCGR_PEP_ID=MMETSP0890-20130614/35732_1 /TAXON_ID=44058 ORGANISM="Aureoumbra lagunensis, Strain CCMP1510" /NCGR_SAMPLE_ID=MMETSP0890 /ASSEMBLY_ACC=CAM_ASM_000533 /LENGTH=553 /DNA_ID=CAMNT_0042771543 /DNA_START=300 /DNA_END=1961 /DNA_ORIENTATION=-
MTLPGIVSILSSDIGPRILAFTGLFCLSALLHSAEVAITTLYPWKVKEFADDEGPRSAFAALDQDITRTLTAILVATTCANVCSTAIFADCATTLLGNAPKYLALATGILTAGTLFFGELLPKAIGVNNAERVARALVPVVNALSIVLGPVGVLFSASAKTLLRTFFRIEFRAVESAVSEEELRLIVGGATRSGGIESLEGTMIEGVLDLQDTRVAEIMRPRVEVDALEENDSMLALLSLVNATGHSRIPVYRDDIDNVVGVVNAKKLLDFLKQSKRQADDDRRLTDFSSSQSMNKEESIISQASIRPSSTNTNANNITNTVFSMETVDFSSPSLVVRDRGTLSVSSQQQATTGTLLDTRVADCAEPTYFVPETMLTWKVLEEMRRRRVHMAIVVDEFGGTAGMVTLEDILELVVGEIYDEDDKIENSDDDKAIVFIENNCTDPNAVVVDIKGTAPVYDLVDALHIPKDEIDVDTLPDVTTAAGLVCYYAGELPVAGDHIFVASFDFEVLEADERRVYRIRARKLTDAALLDWSNSSVGSSNGCDDNSSNISG